MKTVRDILQDADPLRHEPHRLADERARLRRAVVAAGSRAPVPSPTWLRSPAGAWAAVAVVAGIVFAGSQSWFRSAATVQAAIRFEVRQAEDHAAAGLREARVGRSDRVVYLHPEIIATNEDVANSRVVQGDGPSHFDVHVQFNGAGAEKMREATARHIGRPVAILIDGDVVTAPTVRSPISTSAVISGDYTKAEAERIVNGIGIR